MCVGFRGAVAPEIQKRGGWRFRLTEFCEAARRQCGWVECCAEQPPQARRMGDDPMTDETRADRRMDQAPGVGSAAGLRPTACAWPNPVPPVLCPLRGKKQRVWCRAPEALGLLPRASVVPPGAICRPVCTAWPAQGAVRAQPAQIPPGPVAGVPAPGTSIGQAGAQGAERRSSAGPGGGDPGACRGRRNGPGLAGPRSARGRAGPGTVRRCPSPCVARAGGPRP